MWFSINTLIVNDIPLSCIEITLKMRLFTLQVCTSHYWYTDYDYATAIPANAGNTYLRQAGK
ncbi:hypothetical protein FKH18_25045 [Salmonella enterica]|uniref:Uncharacterized protein n=4 Tax=Salmonella enterica TaxID=28901 RepID=A0A6H2Y7W1_SALEB|nr:hypothetical protein [Salmonella enterica subsp. enterica serovar Java]EAN9728438.1 hypothetical protein [Salmonella enterica]EBV8394954.1 hypothetical protein [Salmonella enterica subsp. enterica serovar Virchow]ECA3795523.1 hypothetical protein [Salmonella enterica subsp. enterica serovar Aqua]EDV9618158.1 hypothetical protein [Salmonella enterica subsp. enterica serovar Paratyphi B]